MSMDFSSWPRDQEQTFVVYENRAKESQGKAFMGGLIAAVAFFVIAVGIYVGVPPEEKDMTKGMNMDNLTKKSKKAEPAPTPTPPPAAAPAPAPAAAPAAPAADDKK
jgi:hypothetical protein